VIEVLLILVGVICLTIAGIPGLLTGHGVVQGLLIAVGLVLSIVGQLLAWRNTKTLEERLGSLLPRSLSVDQCTTLQAKLLAGNKATIGVCSRLMDGESADFAEQLASVFDAAGWPMAQPIKTSLNDLPGYLALFVTGEGLETGVAYICAALNETGIDCRLENRLRARLITRRSAPGAAPQTHQGHCARSAVVAPLGEPQALQHRRGDAR
jgi:hypothetical protein